VIVPLWAGSKEDHLGDCNHEIKCKVTSIVAKPLLCSTTDVHWDLEQPWANVCAKFCACLARSRGCLAWLSIHLLLAALTVATVVVKRVGKLSWQQTATTYRATIRSGTAWFSLIVSDRCRPAEDGSGGGAVAGQHTELQLALVEPGDARCDR
jgi:hypothetical protein